MTRPLSEPSLAGQVNRNKWGVRDLRRRPFAGKWIQPVDAGDPIPAEDPIWTPELENDWLQPSAPLETFAFRRHMDGSLEFRGHLDASGGAVSGTVAVTLPGAQPEAPFLEPNFFPRNDQYWHTTITEDDGVTFTLALVFIDSTTGEVTITWPAV